MKKTMLLFGIAVPKTDDPKEGIKRNFAN